MSIKLTPASFVSGVRQSGLIESHKLDAYLLEMERTGIDQNSATALAGGLVRLGAITEWQSEKLLQGRHKGFILGRYKLLSLLGAGEMSAVYLAEHVMLERRCAIKVLPGNKVKDTSYLGRFHREAKAVARLDHPNIVRAYDVDQQFDSGTDIHFLVMEYVAGRNIEKVIADKGPLDVVTAVDFIRQAAEGLSHAHQAGMVHRDIKPENLLIDKDGVVKILDLGLARFFQATEEESLTIKHDEKVLGTADYLAPEQAIDSHKVDARADIYSLGCTFYFALTGHPPFTEGTLVQRLFAHQTKTPKPVEHERPDVPPELVAILEKMMAKKAAERYQTAADLAHALTAWLVENGGMEWRRTHVVQVAGIKGMDGFNDRPAAAKNSSIEKSLTQNSESKVARVNLLPATQPLSNQARLASRARNTSPPKVEFYATTPGLNASQPLRERTGESSAKSPRKRLEPQLVDQVTDDRPSARGTVDQAARLKRSKPQSGAGESAHDETGLNGTATAVANRSSRVNQSQTSMATPAVTINSSRQARDSRVESGRNIFSWFSSNDAMNSQSRRMVTWVTISLIALTCCSALAYWIIQGVTTPEKQLTQPRQDAVIDVDTGSTAA